jgi:hypothetical protein
MREIEREEQRREMSGYLEWISGWNLKGTLKEAQKRR